MTVIIRRTTVRAPLAGDAAFDITIPAFGGVTPKGVLIYGSHATNPEIYESHMRDSHGATDGTRTRMSWIDKPSGQSLGPTRVGGYSSDVFTGTDVLWSRRALADPIYFVSFIPDGVRVNVTGPRSRSQTLNVVLFGGTDLGIHISDVALPASTSPQAVTGLPFTPDLLWWYALSRYGAETEEAAAFGIGWTKNNAGAAEQASANWKGLSGGTSSRNLSSSRNLASYGIASGSTNAFSHVVVQSFETNGFTVAQGSPADLARDPAYIALNFNGAADTQIGGFDSPAATGPQVVPLNFTPQIVVTGHTAITDADTTQNRGSHCLGFIDAGGMSSHWVGSTYGLSTDRAGTFESQVKALHMRDELNPSVDGDVNFVATGTLGANAFTLDYTVVNPISASPSPTGARKWQFLAIEEVSAGPFVDLAGVLDGVGLVAGTMEVLGEVRFAGVLDGVGDIVGTLEALGIVELQGALDGVGDVTGNLGVEAVVDFAGALDGVGLVVGTIAKGGLVDLAGAFNGVGDIVGTLVKFEDRDFAGALDGVGDLIGTVTLQPAINLQGALDGVGLLDGAITLIGTVDLRGALQGVADILGTPTSINVDLQGVLEGVGQLAGTMGVGAEIRYQGALDGVGIIAGTIGKSGVQDLDGSLFGVGDVIGRLLKTTPVLLRATEPSIETETPARTAASLTPRRTLDPLH